MSPIRPALLLLIASLALVPPAATPVHAADEAASPPDTWHATVFVGVRGGLRVVRYWSRGSWLRAETVLDGHPIVTIVRGSDYIAYDRLTATGVRIRRTPLAIDRDSKRARPFAFDFEDLVADGGEKVEESSMGGRATEVWRVRDSEGRRKLVMTRDEPRVPLRLETFLRARGETITRDYTGWRRGFEVAEGFFEPPPNVSIETFDYEAYAAATASRNLAPVLYPDLLLGRSSR